MWYSSILRSKRKAAALWGRILLSIQKEKGQLCAAFSYSLFQGFYGMILLSGSNVKWTALCGMIQFSSSKVKGKAQCGMILLSSPKVKALCGMVQKENRRPCVA